MGWVAFMSCFVHDGNKHCTALAPTRILLGTFELLVLCLGSHLQTVRTDAYRELAFLATMCSNTVFFS